MDKDRLSEPLPLPRSVRPPRSGEEIRTEAPTSTTETSLALHINEPRTDEPADIEPTPKRKYGRPPGKYGKKYQRHKQYERTKPIDESEIGFRRVTKVMNLAARGLTTEDIHKVTKLPMGSIDVIKCELYELLGELNKVQEYRAIRRDILDAGHIKLLKSMFEPERLAKANLYQLAYASEILYKQSRLESNLSTENRSVSFMNVNGDKYRNPR